MEALFLKLLGQPLVFRHFDSPASSPFPAVIRHLTDEHEGAGVTRIIPFDSSDFLQKRCFVNIFLSDLRMPRTKGIVIGFWIVTALFCLQISFTAYAQLRLPQVA